MLYQSPYKYILKRSFDLLVVTVVLAFTWPVFLLLYVLIRTNIGSPVIFKQLRPGYKGRSFMMFKFRTMTNERDKSNNLLPDDLRITSIGRIVRSLSLDELPEIINVFRGEMSLVGPRPLLVEYLNRYTIEQARRHDVRPGITGWAQVNGRNAITWEEKFLLDTWYVDNQSFGLDLRILILTIWKVIRREGIDQEGLVSASVFMGSEHPSDR
jgi:sugar transferase EpsL